MAKQVTKDMIIGDLLHLDKGVVAILMNSGMHCLGCPSSQMETIEDACAVHGIDADGLIKEINDHLATVAE